MADTSQQPKISLKFLVDNKRERVVFAEANHEFVDILFSFMKMAMGASIRFMEQPSDGEFEALGSLKTLFQGLANLPATCFQSQELRALLNPINPRQVKLDPNYSGQTGFLLCKNCYRSPAVYHSTYYTYTGCYNCGKKMNEKTTVTGKGVFVMETASFLVTDSLHVMPNSPVSGIKLLNDLGISDRHSLEEKRVDIGVEEVRNLLRLVLTSKTPLTCLLLPKANATQDLAHLQEEAESDLRLISKKVKATSSMKMTLKVTLQKSTNKLLFVEADEVFVDFLISFLSIPLATLSREFNGGTRGSIDNLYTSISNMSVGKYIKSQHVKDILLQTHSSSCMEVLKLGKRLNYPFKLQDLITQRGFVKGPSMFMVTDDLVISPLSTISIVKLLNKLKVPLADVKERKMSIGMEEGLRILEASLKSSSALTDGLKLPLKKLKQEI